MQTMKEEAISMYQQGADPYVIAEEMDRSVSTIRKWLWQEGISGKPGVRSIVDELNPEQVKEILVAYEDQQTPVSAILKDWGLTYQQLYAILDRADVPPRRGRDDIVAANKKRMDVAVQMYELGHPLKVIKADTGIHAPRLYDELAVRGVPKRQRGQS